MQVGIFSVGDIAPDPTTGRAPTESERLLGLVRMAERAEAAGLDVFAIGEHHQPGHVPPSPPVLLSHIAARTERLMLSTSAAVLPVADPVRMAEEYATLQILADGRIDLLIARGFEPETFQAFGFPKAQSHEIFAEKLDLLLRLWSEEKIDWTGTWREPLTDFTSTPRPRDGRSPLVWLGTTNTESTAELAARTGCGLFVNNIFQTFDWYGRLVAAYREALADPTEALLGFGAHVFMDERSQVARERMTPYFDAHPAFGGVSLEEYCDRTAMTVGSPAEVVDRTLQFREIYGHYQRQLYLVDFAGLPLDAALAQIDFVGQIADEIRTEFERQRPAGHASGPPLSRGARND